MHIQKIHLIAAWFSLILLISGCSSQKNIDRKIHWDFDGTMVIDGRRTFIIGTYHLPKTDKPYETLAINGFNLVHVPVEKQALDLARANNIKAWITTGYIKNSSDKKSEAHIQNIIDHYKDHPSLLFWEMADEPAFKWNHAEASITPEPLINTYKYIKTFDTDHPVYTNHGPVNLISTLQKYNPSTDVVACDIYPVVPHDIKPTYALYPDGFQGDLLNTYISQVGEYTDKMKKVTRNSKPLFMILQAFAWEMLKPEAERDSSKVLYPTYEQTRFMAFNAIVHKANGVIYWGSSYTPQSSEFMDNLYKVTRELSGMKEILAAKTVFPDIRKTYHELRYSIDTGVEILAKELDGTLYLLTVNSDKNPVRISISRLNGFNKAQVLHEDRELEISNGEITDDYKPFDVHLYKLEK